MSVAKLLHTAPFPGGTIASRKYVDFIPDVCLLYVREALLLCLSRGCPVSSVNNDDHRPSVATTAGKMNDTGMTMATGTEHAL